jgi:EAL domain-containing protein (putative c-di-GMP-specific phosphodiesterase class I)
LQGEERFEQVILQLRQAGCLFAVDGVGKGQVSLLYLTRVRPDIIKIAPDMVHDIFTDANRQRLLGTITTLAHQIGSQVVAVGVEKNSDGVTCNHYNVDLLQGYLIGVPSPAVQDDFASLQESWENTLHSYGVSSIKTISRTSGCFRTHINYSL